MKMGLKGRRALLLCVCCALGFTMFFTGTARAADTGTVQGTVRDSDGAPVPDAAVSLQGVASLRTASDSKGSFSFASVPSGQYAIVVTKPGFVRYENDDVDAFIGETTTVNVVLAGSSFSSLRTIANVSTNTPGHARINTSTASVSTISNQTFADQGQTQVMKVLNETPGIIAYGLSENNNGASEGSPQIVQIRGALPYETESLIDGHPTALGLSGSFNPIYLNPALLQDVELVKGPGAMPTEINYAIGGTVNYLTLQPTETPQGMVSVGIDNFGGVTTAIRATGSTKTHRLDYAFGYATDGAPGPLRGYPIAGSQVYLVAGSPPWTINGQQVAGFPEGVGPAPPNRAPFIGVVGQAVFAEPLYVCCSAASTGFHSTAELGKLRLNFSRASALTVSYAGGQGLFDLNGVGLTSLAPVAAPGDGSFSVFAPPAGYTGSVPPGTQIPFDLNAYLPEVGSTQQSLYQGEFRTTFGRFTGLARYFSGTSSEYGYLATPGEKAPYTFSGATWGGIPLCPSGTTFDLSTYLGTGVSNCNYANGNVVAPTTTYFNGQQATFSTNDAVNNTLELDHLRGESLEFDAQNENGGDYAVSVDRSHHDSSSYEFNPPNGIQGFLLPPGSSQQFTTEMLRGRFFLAHRVFANLADYFIQYSSHYTGDGGVTWHDSTHGYNAPRLGLSWRPNVDVAWRFSTGASIAPPYLNLISSSGSAPTPNINGVPSAGYTENANNGAIAPETAWSYDLGLDKRIAQSTSVSFDLYLTTLRDQFLPSTFLSGTFSPPPGQFGAGGSYPLYVSETTNLGHARYEGIEFGIQRAPAVGLGFKIQGTFQRAYAYDIPTGFYCAASAPCTPNTNLGILPNVNFQASGLGWNTINGVAVPYSTGYAEINKRTRYGTYFNLGLTYFGSNNTFSQPAFFIMSGALREPLGPGLSAQLSVDNLLGTYNSDWTNYFGGIPAPLANGQLGPTIGGNYGPTRWRLTFTREFGRK